MRLLVDHPLKDTAEIEITCPHCGYRMMRKAARLRRETEIRCPLCGGTVTPDMGERHPNEPGGRNNK
jgi:DNA-directed RNA polymerase subunit RPC12/RpoP